MPDPSLIEAEMMELLAQRQQKPVADPMMALRGAKSIGPMTGFETPLPPGGENQQPDMIAKMLELSGMNRPLEQMGGPGQAMGAAFAKFAQKYPKLAQLTKVAEPAARNTHPATQDDFLNSLNPNWHANITSTAGTRSEPFIAPGGDWGDDMLTELATRTKRLSIPARSRAFRSNTPLPE